MLLKKNDAVFKGVGVKGIGLVGAFSVLAAEGYMLENLAGTSAGAIVTALVAAGYNATELQEILEAQDFAKFMDKGWEDEIPLVGSMLNLITEKGIYEGNFFENWLRELLAKKGVHTFGDLVMSQSQDNPRYRYKLQVNPFMIPDLQPKIPTNYPNFFEFIIVDKEKQAMIDVPENPKKRL